MKYFYIAQRILFLLLFIMGLGFHNGIYNLNSEATSHTLFKPAYDYETFNLGITEVLTEVETIIQRNIVLSHTWEQLLLNISVQNFGDPLDSVYLEVKANNVPIRSRFNKFEKAGIGKAFSYQFEIAQTLILALNHTHQKEIELEIRLLLDHSITWRDPNVNFLISEAEIIGFDISLPSTWELLPISVVYQHYQIQPSKVSMLEKSLLMTTYLFVQFPSDMQLKCMGSVELNGTSIDSVTVNEQPFSSEEGKNSISFNFTLNEQQREQGIPVRVLVFPRYEGLSGLTHVSMSISISGVLESYTTSPFEDVLGSHPIPPWLMFPILLIVLFGVPYYLVYQEHLVDRDKRILDPKKLTKL